MNRDRVGADGAQYHAPMLKKFASTCPWQNAYVERFIGSIRECLDQMIVVSRAQQT